MIGIPIWRKISRKKGTRSHRSFLRIRVRGIIEDAYEHFDFHLKTRRYGSVERISRVQGTQME